MKIYLLLLLSLFFSICCFTLQISAQTNQPSVVNLDKIEFDQTTVIIPCRHKVMRSTCSSKTITNVKTNISAPGKKLKYQYSVTGGQIIGNGRKVKWDLLGVRPGLYKITVTANDNQGFSKILTEAVTVADCPDCNGDCLVCPIILVDGSTGIVKVADKIAFTANVSGGSSDTEYTYKWRVSGGKIISGQGKPFIKVKVNKSAKNRVTAELKIGGACPECKDTAAETIEVTPKQ